MAQERVIVHIDMDAFFAAVEQRDRPELRGKPVVIGADPKGGKGRGVVSTASYEARRFGIHSAQPISQAWRCCPFAAYLPPDGEKYSRESARIRAILEEFTPQIEFVSIDEGYLDVTGSLRLFGGKRRLAQRIQQRIEEETALTASLGVAPNKLLAKIASELKKPRGLVVVEPEQVEEFLRPLEVRRLPGVGPKMQESLTGMGVATIGQLAEVPRETLEERFGEWGKDLWRKAHGLDEGPVEEGGEAKSIGHEHTYDEDTDDYELARSTLMRLSERTARRLRQAGKAGHTVTTKVRFEGFVTVTRRQTLERPVCEATGICEAALENFAAARPGGRRIRLVGVSVSGFVDRDVAPSRLVQRQLFGDAAPTGTEDVRRRIARAEDAVKDRFGDDAIRRGSSFRSRSPDRGSRE
jgi:nucleotidyltransferase/DNA polymerase involved in DNA repair